MTAITDKDIGTLSLPPPFIMERNAYTQSEVNENKDTIFSHQTHRPLNCMDPRIRTLS